MTAIVRQQDSLSRRSKRQYFGVRHRGVSISRFQRRKHIVVKASQFHNNLQCDVLV